MSLCQLHVFPTHVGMNRPLHADAEYKHCVPHTRGDEPVFADLTQAMRRIPMYMHDWIKKLDGFLTLNDRNILDHAGKVSNEMAVQLAADDYKNFYKQRLQSEAEQADKRGFEILTKQIADKDKSRNK